ncbi:MAG: hypothetical protein FJX35_23115 [Alphaproteobacteria bacterium]|nr:hypothetical protein [Alphaproteobacteria bacterium]
MVPAILTILRARLLAILAIALLPGMAAVAIAGAILAAYPALAGSGGFYGAVAAACLLATLVSLALAWISLERMIMAPVAPVLRAVAALAAGEVPARLGPPYASGPLGRLAEACDGAAQRQDELARQLKLSEARTEQARSRFADIVESTSEAVAYYDEDDHLVFVNSRFRAFFPELADAISPGMTFTEVCRMAAELGQFAGAEGRAAAWVSERLEQRRYPDRPHERSTGENWFRIRDRVTRSGGTITVYADITPSKSAEIELESRIAEAEASRDQMEAQSRQLAALADSYAEARRLSEYANRAKSEFLARMSHELRTPLNAIIGFADIMRNGMFGPLGSPRYHDYVADIRSSGRHLLDIINDILDLAKIEAGRYELAEERIDPARIIASTMRFVRERAQIGGVQLVTTIGPDTPMLRADERSLKQIMVNLLSNAVKFTPSGGTVTAFTRLTAAGELVIGVTDTGIGMAAGEIPEALRPFGQTKSAHVAANEGTGLGLALVKSMIELHGGKLDLESSVGVGTTAMARFPADRVVARLAEAV